ncbi:mucin [Beauveria brongniartii RCEF 3172]|uniref:Mucin n=1 Tax=Beauveria brongniartii RCEF 3172 TaxID=1081107 RepID=A0A167DH42_9HYPO|nr:mucin [Beauveria brongniartii RCEF 3172]
MPYNTRRKSLSLPSLGIHIPGTHASRAAALASASKSASRLSTSPTAPAPESAESHPSKRLKRSHAGPAPVDALNQTPPPSPTVADSIEMTDADSSSKIDLSTVNDDIVEGVIVQLQTTGNRPHLVKDLAIVLGQTLTSVQQSANPCAIISSRLASYLKRPVWSSAAPCPLAKELETVHPRRTYFFLTTQPRLELPDPSIVQPILPAAIVTPSVSLTDDSGSDVEGRRRELSPSPEVDLSPHEVEDGFDDMFLPITPAGSFSSRRVRVARDFRHDSPPLEKDEREFTQTADVVLKRKLSEATPVVVDPAERAILAEYGFRDDMWFSDTRTASSTAFLASPAMKPSVGPIIRKDDDADNWLRLFGDGQGAESIEIDELDGLLDAY